MIKFYATRDIAIDGKHFAAGKEIKDVDQEQIDLAGSGVSTTKPGDMPPPPKPPARVTNPAPTTGTVALDTDSADALVGKA